MDYRFTDIIQLIQQSRNNAIRSVNTELINLYWNIGAYVKQKISVAEWGDKTVDELANFIQKNNPELKGFNRAGLYRMIQFYETYAGVKFVASVRTQFDFQPQDIRNTVLVQISWTHHRTIFSRCKTEEEREFYLRMAIKENYSVRELDRQINASLFERVMIGNAKISTLPGELNPNITILLKTIMYLSF